ncbi:hypothetical protein [Helicobacter turcicus]|uniref:hypothetical protein n=1 Tax=Helicobacter turcicus TaxID=2867412 RepID=UPI003211AABE
MSLSAIKDLALVNSANWCKISSTLAKKYIVEFGKKQDKGQSDIKTTTKKFLATMQSR